MTLHSVVYSKWREMHMQYEYVSFYKNVIITYHIWSHLLYRNCYHLVYGESAFIFRTHVIRL
jgi:hypothetical protein